MNKIETMPKIHSTMTDKEVISKLMKEKQVLISTVDKLNKTIINLEDKISGLDAIPPVEG